MARLSFDTTICGVNQIGVHAGRRFTHVVSILDPGASSPIWPAGFETAPRLDLRFHDATAAGSDSVMFSAEHVDALIVFASQIAESDQPLLLVHCTQGMSRSTACTAIIHAYLQPALSGVTLFTEILRIRDITWPNLQIVELGDMRLGRRGDLIAGAKAVYRYQLAKRPSWVEELTRVGRGREVAAAVEGEVITL
jgi:predicted protein tyrosine phosphatase